MFFNSCSRGKHETFKICLNDYLESHALGLLYRQDSLGNNVRVNCNYPSYHAYFFRDSLEVINVVLFQKLYYTSDISTTFANPYWNSFEYETKGFFIYREDMPIVIHDSQNSSEQYLFEQLEINIPDSLIYTGEYCNNEVIHLRNNAPKLYKLSR